jgi:glucosamine--fructose-6-phosphate aminotransferase (isomerizing)
MQKDTDILEALLARELRQAPDAVARQQQELRQPLHALVERLAQRPPQVVVTCARGSSAHAATFGKHLIERHLRIPVAAAAPVVATAYKRDLRLKDQFVIIVSQSGRSDDLIEQARSARRAGALTAALVNEVNSPLAQACEFVLPIGAGAEESVAATKSFVASLSALLRLTAHWTGDRDFDAAIDRLPDRLARATELDWAAARDGLAKATGLIAIGRGPTLAIAREAALKLKETCGVQAEAYSGAEFMHGPVTLVAPGYPILMFVPNDEAAADFPKLADDLVAKHAAVFTTANQGAGMIRLPALARDNAETDAVCLIQSFYGMMVGLAEQRGMSADRPRHLQKVTRTK